MLGHLQPRFRQIKDLSFLDPRRHSRIQFRPTMAAAICRVALDDVGLVRLPQRVTFMPNLAATCLAGAAPQTTCNPRLFAQPVARWRLTAVVAVFAQLPPKIRHFLFQLGDFMPEPFDQCLEFGGKFHPYLDSYPGHRRNKNQ